MRGDVRNTRRLLFAAGVAGLYPLILPGVAALATGALVAARR